MKFKTDKIESDWDNNKISSKLKDLVFMGDEYSKLEFGKELTITDLNRTQAEQDDIYSYSEKYKTKPWKSVHQFGRGCDLRVRDFTQNEIDKLKAFFNMITYDKTRSNKFTCLVHDVGKGKHFHLQSLS